MDSDTITEIAKMYSSMSLCELLAEENLITEALHRRAHDTIRTKILKVLRTEIERRLQ